MGLLKKRKLTIYVLAMASLFFFSSSGFSQEMDLHADEDSEVDSAGTDSGESDPSRGIIGGEVDNGHPQVGKMVDDQGKLDCTGTLIGTQTVLTAAHCAENGDYVDFEIGGQIHEGTFNHHPDYVDTDHGPDLAVITLWKKVEGIPPIPLCNTSPNLQDLPITIVGYGTTSGTEEDSGIKHRARTQVFQSSSITLRSRYRPMACYGDSGGPVLINSHLDGMERRGECIVGVISSGDTACKSWGKNPRPDGHYDWLAGRVDPTVSWVTPGGEYCTQDFPEDNEECRFASYWRCNDDNEMGRTCFWGNAPEPDDGGGP